MKGLTYLKLDSPLTAFIVGAYTPNNLTYLILNDLQMERLDLTGYDFPNLALFSSISEKVQEIKVDCFRNGEQQHLKINW